MKRAVFLDRDGTIIEDAGYLRDSEAIRPLPDALEALRRFYEAGWLLVVITNQSGVGRGIISREEMLNVRSAFETVLARAGAHITATYCCLHAPEEKCGCRKPSPSLFFRAAAENSIDLSNSWMVGDRESDILGGIKAGCSTIWLRNNIQAVDPSLPDFTAEDWSEIERIIAPSTPHMFR